MEVPTGEVSAKCNTKMNIPCMYLNTYAMCIVRMYMHIYSFPHYLTKW